MSNKTFTFANVLAAGAVALLAAGAAQAQTGGTLAAVKQRGVVNCGVNTSLPGFSTPDAQGNWTGLDVVPVRRLPPRCSAMPRR